MNAKRFRKLLDRLDRRPSALFRRILLQTMMRTTAKAFEMPPERLFFRAPDHALQLYADYTVSCMEHAAADPERIYDMSYELGERIRRWCGPQDPQEMQRLVFLLYRSIGITMRGELADHIEVPACFFSRIYTPEQCRIMSCMDSGIVSGICGGGRLIFTARLTEGCDRCIACLERKENDE